MISGRGVCGGEEWRKGPVWEGKVVMRNGRVGLALGRQSWAPGEKHPRLIRSIGIESTHTYTHTGFLWPLPAQFCSFPGTLPSSTSAQPVNYPNSAYDDLWCRPHALPSVHDTVSIPRVPFATLDYSMYVCACVCVCVCVFPFDHRLLGVGSICSSF